MISAVSQFNPKVYNGVEIRASLQARQVYSTPKRKKPFLNGSGFVLRGKFPQSLEQFRNSLYAAALGFPLIKARAETHYYIYRPLEQQFPTFFSPVRPTEEPLHQPSHVLRCSFKLILNWSWTISSTAFISYG